MGASHCQWGVFTDRNVCNIYGEKHTKNQAPRSIGYSGRGVTDTWKEGGKLGNI